MPLYRNQTNTLTQIKQLAGMRVTTTQEAVALLRAFIPLYEQVCAVLQRNSVNDQDVSNKPLQPVQSEEPEIAPTPEPNFDNKLEPEEFNEDEDFSEDEKAKRVEELKAATVEVPTEEEYRQFSESLKAKKNKKVNKEK